MSRSFAGPASTERRSAAEMTKRATREERVAADPLADEFRRAPGVGEGSTWVEQHREPRLVPALHLQAGEGGELGEGGDEDREVVPRRCAG
jgi:hypothetical protein